MMKKLLIPAVSILSAAVLTGCGGTKTTTFDPTDPQQNQTRAIGTVSQAECFMAAREAAQNALTSPQFDRFMAQYRQETNDPQATPLMQVGYLSNRTNDPDLQINLVTDELCTALSNSGKVDVTLATGRDASQSFADARDLRNDPNFKKSTVRKQGTLEAPRLSLEGSVLSQVTRDGNETVQVYSFNLKLADLETGRVIWSYNKPFGTKKTRSPFGW